MKTLLVFLVLITALATAFFGGASLPVHAQTDEEITFQNVQLWVNPEYDDPRLLVMMEGKVAGAGAPVELSFLVPSAAEMYSAGSMDAQGVYSGGPPAREASDIAGWDRITYTVQTDTFRVEYYDPVIIGQSEKTISYDFRWLYPIADLEVTVQEPRGSSDYTVTPEGKPFIDNSGFASHIYSYFGLDDNPPLHFEIAYTKTSPALSVSQTAAPVNTGNSGAQVTLMVMVVIAVAGGFLWVFRSKFRARPVSRRAARSAPIPKKKKQTRFCTQCGGQLDGDYQFCPHCGKNITNK